ncbi:MAG: hypothetical protein NVSMB52_11500 [Chloroflexota bacterium]
MLNLGVLDIAIGLTFVYLLASILCTAISEMVEAVWKFRGANLERGIGEMFNEPRAPGEGKSHAPRGIVQSDSDTVADPGETILSKLYNHGLVSSLFTGDYLSGRRGRCLPSYIPASNFALALTDLVLAGKFAAPGRGVDYRMDAGQPDAADPLAPLRAAIGDIENKKVQEVFVALLGAPGIDAQRLQEQLQNWYNSAMDRVSGTYKRKTQGKVFLLGLAISLSMNADTLSILNNLSTAPALRSAWASAAGEYARAGAKGARFERDGHAPATSEATAGQRYQDALIQLQRLGLPTGWPDKDPKAPALTDCFHRAYVPWWLSKLAGWLLTAFAISLGAPFWFDMLSKVMVVRSTVKPHEKSPEEPAIPKKAI